MKKWMFGLGAAAAVPALATASLLLGGNVVSVPDVAVNATQSWLGAGGALSTIDVTLFNVPGGYDVVNGQYKGWCMEDNHRPNAPAGSLVTLYDSTDTSNLPAGFACVPWDQVNYMLNNKGGASVVDVQIALWLLTGTYDGTFGGVTAGAQALFNDATANGAGFIPGDKQYVAVLLYNDGLGVCGASPDSIQDTLIEVMVDNPGGEGCTPGYWRNHLSDWTATGYSTGDNFDAVFGTSYFGASYTLGQAIVAKGGGLGKLARHGTAALLSAAHPDVNYPYTVAEVKAKVQSGDIDPLVLANELGCDIPKSDG